MIASIASMRSSEIPGLVHLMGAPVNDARLKVLWLEDKEAIGVTDKLIPFVQLTRIRVPEAGEALLRLQREEVREQLGAATYRLPECPYDIYIADHRLDEAPTNEVGEPSNARLAEACGLTTAVMMALTFPLHPASIIPYTAYVDQVKYQRDLLQRLCPGYVNVCWGDELGKLELGVDRVMLDALRSHRTFLITAADEGILYLRGSELARVRGEFEACRDNQHAWPGDRTMTFETEWGSRSIFLGALWPEAIVDGRPVDEARATAVTRWLDAFPAPADDEQKARGIAERYFQLSVSLRSSYRYELGHMIRQGVGPIGSSTANQFVGKLCDIIGLEHESVQAAVVEASQKKAKKVAIPSEWAVPHMLTNAVGLGKPLARLAVLCLLVREEAARWQLRESLIQGVPEEVGQYLATLSRTLNKSQPELIQELAELREKASDPSEEESQIAINTFADRFHMVPHDGSAAFANSVLGLIERWRRDEETGPLTPRFLPRLIDPLPEQIDTADDDVSEGRIGKALWRIDLYRRAASDGVAAGDGMRGLAALLSTGNGDLIAARERRVMHRFALELNFPKAFWPGWMR